MEGQPSEPHHQDKPCDNKCGAVGAVSPQEAEAFETGKVKFLPYAEAQRLSSGAQRKKYREINYSRTAMQSKNVTPNLSVPRVKENPSLKHPEFPIPRVKEHPGFKLPVADISRLTSGAQEKNPHESNNSRTAMPAKNVIPNFSLPRLNKNPSSQLPSHGGAQIIRMIDQKTAKKSEKSKEKYDDKKRPGAAFMLAKEAEILKPKTKEVKTPNSNSDYSRYEASYGSSTPMCSLPISTGQTLHAVAGNNCSFEERDLPNILPKLKRYLPSLEATWNGEFLFSDTATPGERYGGFMSHPPCKIHYKAFEFAQKFPNDLQVKLLPRCPLWEELSGDRTPDFRDIALYFFPADNTERS
ncbi:hypothetical protein Q3G72_003226 [Acer saccharum]|nr:hypothetical protein Q3G72_003226 [Acer saccharum]